MFVLLFCSVLKKKENNYISSITKPVKTDSQTQHREKESIDLYIDQIKDDTTKNRRK